MKILLVLIVSVNAAVCQDIVGGAEAPNHKYPYQASLRKNGVHRCGGAIYNETVVLTAAHCVYLDYSTKTVVVGTNYLNESTVQYSVTETIIHSGYSSYSDENDIALLILNTPIVFNETIQPIQLETNNILADVYCTITGWGFTSYPGSIANNLQELNVLTISNVDCMIAFSIIIYSSNICTFSGYGEGACKGDSGSPLACNGRLVGLVSWGEPCAVGYPDVFTRISSFADWIIS